MRTVQEVHRNSAGGNQEVEKEENLEVKEASGVSVCCDSTVWSWIEVSAARYHRSLQHFQGSSVSQLGNPLRCFEEAVPPQN